MKKLLSLVLCLTLVFALTGCGKKDTTETTATVEATTEEAATTDAATTEATTETATTDAATTETAAATGLPSGYNVTSGNAKTGLGIVSSIASSKDAGDEDGLAEVDSYVCGVIVGEDGKILDCSIDAIQSKINFSKEGKITTDLATAFQTKNELGEGYGMKGASSIGKEWNEQAEGFAQYVIGKTVDEVKGIAVTDDGHAGDADLASSVTVHVGDFISVVEKAVTNAQSIGANAGDKLGLGVTSSIAKSADAGDEAGVAEAYTYYNATTTDASGKITSSVIDASISDVNFDKTGKITSDLAAALQSKQELGDAYGMKSASSIGKEWFEEANGFASYVTGKTVDEVKGIAVTDEGLAGDADLASSVTVHVGDFMTIVEKAVANAAK